MPAALPLTAYISQASSASRNYRTLTIKYGNGYEQRAQDGINSIEDTWKVQWSNLSAANFATLTAAFDTAAGTDYFTWTAPGDSTSKKWVLTGQMSKTAKSGNLYEVAATLRQVFDL